MEKQPRNRSLDLIGIITVLGVLLTIFCNSYGFIRDTQAANKKVNFQSNSLALAVSRMDRMDGNIQIIMHAQHLTPLRKTPSEIILERGTTSYTPLDEIQ